jgi:signal peptidase I
VFKYPNEAATNYIKRLVGLPNETVRIWHGDIYVKRTGESEFRLARREPSKIVAMAQTVYDNDYVDDTMTERGWPVRWQPRSEDSPGAQGNWTTADGSRSYMIDGSSSDMQWLRYRHFTPLLSDWARMAAGPLPSDRQVKPSLITDFYAYDTSIQHGDPLAQPQMLGLHWVGDLLLECQLDSQASQGEVFLELIKGGRRFGCTFDCQSGQARLSIDGLDDYHPTARTPVRGSGRHDVRFANVDEQLLLWVDGRPITFDAPTTYDPLDNDRPRSSAEEPGDLAPARIGARSAAVTVRHLRLLRDIYYIAATLGGPLSDYASESPLWYMNYQELAALWSSPAEWEPPRRVSPFDQRREALFTLAADQFFVLGDNSPMSMDARLWGGEPYVSRELLVGKALLIFWPHSFNRVPGTNIPFPYFPNFARMRFIR